MRPESYVVRQEEFVHDIIVDLRSVSTVAQHHLNACDIST